MLSDNALLYLESQKADNTIRAYSSDWRKFSIWCATNGLVSLPASPETVANYIASLADTLKANTISRHLTTIKQMHNQNGFAKKNPADDYTVKSIMRSIKRKLGTAQHGKAAITADILKEMLPHIKKDLAGTRNKALLLIGFAGAFRRSELVKIRLQDIEFFPNGISIWIPRSKADQRGQGQKIAIEYGENPDTCPIKALHDWLRRARITDGYIFRPVTKYGFIKATSLDDRLVALIIKHYAEMAGLNPDQFSGHSLRRGYATTAAKAGASTLAIMHQTRHKSERMVHKYIEEAEIFADLPKIWKAA